MYYTLAMDETLHMTTLADFLRREIRQRGWTQRHLEDVTGISKTGMRALLRGDTETPTLDTLRRISKAFGVPLRRLLDMTGYPIETAITEEEEALIARLDPDKRAKLREVIR